MGFTELWSTYGGKYIEGLLTTWGMTVACFASVMVVSVAVTVLRVSPFKPLRWIGDFYVQVFRNIPGVSLLVFIVYALPYLDIVIDYLPSVMVTVVLVASAFGSENFMSGINTIGVGQVEAARALGMGFGKIIGRIVIPQALRSTVLPMTNLFIGVLLTTALGSQVPMDPAELTGVVAYVNTRSVGGVLAFAIAALGYALTALVIGAAGSRLDRKVRVVR